MRFRLLCPSLVLLACACATEETSMPAGDGDDRPASGGSGGKSGSAGSVSSSGKTSGEPEPAEGGAPAEDQEGGASAGGSQTSGGSGGKPASGGKPSTAGSSGSGGSAATGNGWKFPSNVESWTISYGEPGSLMGSGSLSHDGGAGNPENGSLKVTVPFNGVDQKLDVSIALDATNLTGKTITAKVKLDSGLSTSPDNPGGAKLYVKTGDAYVYADGGWTNLDGNWASLSLNVSSPGGFVAGTHTPSDVREIGIEIATGSQGSYSSATVHIDTVVY